MISRMSPVRNPTTACAVKSVQLIGLFYFRPSVFPRLIKRNEAHLRRGIAALNAGEGKEHEVLADEDNAATPNEDRPRR